MLKVAIIGSGPSALYTASHLLKHTFSICISIFERLPVPFGLVRYGVAPDHQDVKNVTHKFNSVLADPRVKFIGNLGLTKDGALTRAALSKGFHATVLSCGASDLDNVLDIPGSNSCSAREFVNWYNGVPGSSIDPNLMKADLVSVIGLGNVAIDCARILLKDHCDLKSTDIPEQTWKVLERSRIRHVDIIGRRGPMEELRELLTLRELNVDIDSDIVISALEALPKGLEHRPRKRLLDIMLKNADNKGDGKSISIRFNESPVSASGKNLLLSSKTGKMSIPCDYIIKSIGYKSLGAPGYPFDGSIVPNDGVFVSGWLKTGPKGVIASTMHDAVETADELLFRFADKDLDERHGIDLSGLKIVDAEGWARIDKEEIARGVMLGKPREKITDLEEMLKISCT